MSHVLGVNLLACLFLFVAPLLPWSNVDVRWNEPLTGAVIAAAALATVWNRVRPSVGAGVTIVAGAWLAVSSLFLPYPPTRCAADVMIGCLVAVVSVIELIPSLNTGVQ